MDLRAALRLGQQLLDAHGLPDWTVGLDRAKTRAGSCAAGHLVQRHRRPVRVLLCTRCRGPQTDRVLQWTHRGQPVPMHPDYVTELQGLASPVSPSAIRGALNAYSSLVSG